MLPLYSSRTAITGRLAGMHGFTGLHGISLSIQQFGNSYVVGRGSRGHCLLQGSLSGHFSLCMMLVSVSSHVSLIRCSCILVFLTFKSKQFQYKRLQDIIVRDMS